MTRKFGLVRWLSGLAILAAAECATVAGVGLVTVTPAAAQLFDQRYPSLSRQRPRSGGFFESLFGGGRPRQEEREVQPQAPADYSRAPAVRKDAKTDQPEPTTSIVVLGDSMADWLAYGLEDAFSDAPEVAIVRKNKQHSGLLRYDAKGDLDWWHVARDLLAPEKANYVVMMLGVSDRQNLREKDVAKEAEQQATKDAATPDQAKETDDEQGIVAPEPKPTAKRANGVIEFRSEQWEKVYTRRIDDTIAALKSKGVPVFWVGLPSIRGAKSTADVSYLNDLYRARVEKAGAVYVDVWDGFVDEEGKYTTFGPDYEGQMRRLRAGDGVYFTKYGARKLAHYVEREIRRYMANRGPIALPTGPMGPLPADGKSAVRPLAGPVVPLTTVTGNNDELVGGSGAAAARADALASTVLVKGEAVTPARGRADDFIWPPGSERPKVEAPAAAPVAKPATSAPQAAVVPPSAPPVTAPRASAAPVALTPPASAPSTPVTPTAPVAAKPESATPIIMAPEPMPQAKPVETKPVETKPVETKPVEAKVEPDVKPQEKPAAKPKPAPAPRRAAEQHPRPPQPIQRPQQPQQRRDNGFFGANGPFGFLR